MVMLEISCWQEKTWHPFPYGLFQSQKEEEHSKNQVPMG